MVIGLRSDKILKNWDSKTYLDEFEKEIKKDNQLKEATTIRKNNETLLVVTKEKYYYTIIENDIIINDKDRFPPNDADISLSSTRIDVGNTVTATVTVSDDLSGIDLENCKYIINHSGNKLDINSSNWLSAQKLTDITSQIPITSNTRGTLYLHILSTDLEGNQIETVSSGIYFASQINLLDIPRNNSLTDSYAKFYTPSGWSLNNSWNYLVNPSLSARGGMTANLESTNSFDLTGIDTLTFSCRRNFN